MKYNDQYFYKKLEILEIIEELKSHCILKASVRYFNKMNVMNDLELIKEELAKVKEAYSICVKYERSPIYLSYEYDELLDIAVKGGILSGIELFETVKMFSSIRANERLLGYLEKDRMDCKYFKSYVSNLYILVELEKVLRKSLDDNGDILDDASPELKKIRNRLKGIDDRIKHRLQEIIGSNSSYLADSVVVIRDDRYCLAVKAEYKNSFKGILHDVSSSNLTAFMEPLQIAEMSNEKDRLRNEEKQEMERILRYLSDLVASEAEVLKNNYLTLIELDKIFAKAKLGISYNGSAPSVNNKGIFDLKNARHPLLKVEKVIPNNIDFGKNHLGIVITGPNTGGKTVLLKTVGLLSLMVKFGLLIPADETSNIMIFDHIFCDIGDDQSIVENLSTFSSHMKKMVAIVNQVTPNSLALFDEIGSGTDPVEGAQIAIAVLNYFVKKNVSFITTTHYAELKAYAYTKERVVNASMAFNEDTMEPTYHLVIGKSGSSNALSIAKNLGLKQEIIDAARHHFNTNSSDTRALINSIEKKVRQLEKLEEQYKIDIKNANEVKETYEKKLDNIDKEKEKVLNDALKEASRIVDEAVEKANKLLEEVKELQGKGVKLHEIIEAQAQIDNVSNSVNANKPKKKVKKKVIEPVVGNRVYLVDYQQYGTIKRIRKDLSLDVEIGNISVNVFKEDIEIVEVEEPVVVHNVVVEKSSSTKSVKLSLDLRGARFSDAKDMLEKYIDDLLMANIKSATIIHGFGTGTIRELVQDYCRKSKYIDSYRYGVAGEGGLGVTVITLK